MWTAIKDCLDCEAARWTGMQWVCTETNEVISGPEGKFPEFCPLTTKAIDVFDLLAKARALVDEECPTVSSSYGPWCFYCNWYEGHSETCKWAALERVVKEAASV